MPDQTSTAAPERILRVLFVLLAGAAVLFLFLGRYPSLGFVSLEQLEQDKLAQQLVLNLRLPRLLASILLGMALSAAGSVFQMIFSNPLVEPGFLGVSQGAAFGAAFGIIFLSNSVWVVQASAAGFAFLGLLLSYFLARRVRFGGWTLRLVLSGIAISALYASGVGILKYLADPLSQLQEITFWLLGGLYAITWAKLRSVAVVVLLSLYVLYRARWRLNLLALSDETAFSLGIAPGRERALLLTMATLATAAMVSVSGMVGWVGLIIPHIARRIFGADTRYVLPASMLIGAMFTLICDTMGRTLLNGEIPLGILTSLIGAAIFILMMLMRGIRAQA
ncbi:MAG: iron ABC transporter permease [Anaerolineae bacterium]|nr:iron ABC transporter permease [Anaerolineae bacterium]